MVVLMVLFSDICFGSHPLFCSLKGEEAAAAHRQVWGGGMAQSDFLIHLGGCSWNTDVDDPFKT